MKLSILFILVLTFIPQSITPQSKNGTLSIGGKVSYYTSDTENKISGQSYFKNEKYKLYSISPRVGYFISDNAQFGIGVKYEKSNREYKTVYNETSYNEKTSMFTFAPSLRFYSKLTENFGFYGEFEAAIGSGTMERTESSFRGSYSLLVEYGYNVKENTISFNPGIYYSVTDKFRMELSIGGIYYSSITTEVSKPSSYSGEKNTKTDFGAGFTFESLALGMVYVF